MTKDKDEKAVIRARMKRTGESYAAARAQLKKDASADGPETAEEPVVVSRQGEVRQLTDQATKASRATRTERGTAWHLVLALRATDGIAGRVLTELDLPASSWDDVRGQGERSSPPGQAVSGSWAKAIAFADSLAGESGRGVIDSGLLLRGAVQALTDDEVPPTHLATLGALRDADLPSLCAEAEAELGPESLPQQRPEHEGDTRRPGLFGRFTDRARGVVVAAQEEARALDHGWIGTEHLLLGLLNVTEGVAAKALVSMGVSLPQMRERIVEVVGIGETTPQMQIPFTPRAKTVLEMSLQEATALGHNYIGTEHLLLGLVAEGQGVAGQVLIAAGATEELVRARVIALLQGLTEPAPEE